MISFKTFTEGKGKDRPPESFEDQYKRRVVKTTDPEHKEKGFDWRIKGKKDSKRTMKLFKNSDKKDSIYFIHLNHTNPALNKNSVEYKKVIHDGFNITEFGQILKL